VLDMIMDPGINGRETYQRIINLHPNQKAVIASGFSETGDVKAAQELGAGQYIKKPYTLEKIGIAIRDELKK
jgi:two-component system, cell cycle sensor histidine kinase and response regulator CckA